MTVHASRRAFARAFLAAALPMIAASLSAGTAFAAAIGEPTVVSEVPAAPAGIPREYLVTPNGFFHPSCVQRVEPDETVRRDGTIARADGTTRSVAPCAFPHFAADGTAIAPDAAPMPAAMHAADPPDINGWVVYSSYTVAEANAAIRLASNMSVPSAPSVHAGQVVYFFPGLEDVENVVTILQPVLGWNAFNDNGWTIASWNCCLDGHTWHSAAVRVDTGDTLYGLVSSSRCNGSVCTDWSILTRDLTSGRDTTLNTQGYGQAFSWIFGAVLESYGITECGNLPDSTTEEFSGIAVRTLTAPVIATSQLPAWDETIFPSTPDCGYASVPHPKPNSPQITLSY